MAEAQKPARSELLVRALSGAAMAALAIGSALVGGGVFALFWCLAAIAILAEWISIVTGGRSILPVVAGGAALVAATVAASAGHMAWSALAVLVGTAGVLALCRGAQHKALAAAGLVYAACGVVPIVLIRADAALGLAATLCLFAIVWGCDVMAYFTGRTFGGPKLWPRVSPKKTWSGFIGGVLSGAVAATAVAAGFGIRQSVATFLLYLVLAIASQGGDLFESALKRRFGTKDASHLIPGHGGVMDRLDGFIAAALVALAVAAFRDPDHLGAGLLLW